MKTSLVNANLQGSASGLDDLAEAIADVIFEVLKDVDIRVPPHPIGGVAFPAKIV